MNGFSQKWNGKVGVSIDFGNEVKRVGLSFDINGNCNFIQGNSFIGFYYNFLSWGVQSKTPEIKLGVAAHFGIGKQDNETNPFISLSDRNIQHNFSIGYAYQYYFDWQGTSQSTGLLAFSHKNFSILTENDLLGAGKGWRDRFRTGGIKLNYRYQEYRFGVNLQLYTGDYASCTKVTDNKNYPARYGYRMQDKAVYGDKSLGLISIESEYVGPYYQTAKLNLGLNSEKVRHHTQNKGLHDMPFYTDKMVKRKLMHIPMLQKDGTIYTFEKNQTLKAPKFFYNIGLNSTAFY